MDISQKLVIEEKVNENSFIFIMPITASLGDAYTAGTRYIEHMLKMMDEHCKKMKELPEKAKEIEASKGE